MTDQSFKFRSNKKKKVEKPETPKVYTIEELLKMDELNPHEEHFREIVSEAMKNASSKNAPNIYQTNTGEFSNKALTEIMKEVEAGVRLSDGKKVINGKKIEEFMKEKFPLKTMMSRETFVSK